jgi:hypothetical protein
MRSCRIDEGLVLVAESRRLDLEDLGLRTAGHGVPEGTLDDPPTDKYGYRLTLIRHRRPFASRMPPQQRTPTLQAEGLVTRQLPPWRGKSQPAAVCPSAPRISTLVNPYSFSSPPK